jgi:hypothetical protein
MFLPWFDGSKQPGNGFDLPSQVTSTKHQTSTRFAGQFPLPIRQTAGASNIKILELPLHSAISILPSLSHPHLSLQGT